MAEEPALIAETEHVGALLEHPTVTQHDEPHPSGHDLRDQPCDDDDSPDDGSDAIGALRQHIGKEESEGDLTHVSRDDQIVEAVPHGAQEPAPAGEQLAIVGEADELVVGRRRTGDGHVRKGKDESPNGGPAQEDQHDECHRSHHADARGPSTRHRFDGAVLPTGAGPRRVGAGDAHFDRRSTFAEPTMPVTMVAYCVAACCAVMLPEEISPVNRAISLEISTYAGSPGR